MQLYWSDLFLLSEIVFMFDCWVNSSVTQLFVRWILHGLIKVLVEIYIAICGGRTHGVEPVRIGLMCPVHFEVSLRDH